MNMIEFIHTRYPIKNKIEQMKKDPVTQIMERDDLPCDDVRVVDGVLQKVVEISDDTYVPVLEILSYCKEDVDKMCDVDFKEAWYAYMDNIDLTDMTLDEIMSSAKTYAEMRKKKDEMVNKCMS